MPSIPPPRTLINSLEPEEERQRSSVDKTQIPHDRLRNVSGMLRALKVISPTLVGPLSSPFAQSIPSILITGCEFCVTQRLLALAKMEGRVPLRCG